MPHEDEQFDTLPPAIIDALRELDGPAVMPDANREADLLSGARQHLAKATQVDRKRRNLRLFFAGSAGGAAAMIAFVVFIGNPAQNEAPLADMAAMPADESEASIDLPGDVDQNGTIDILDAYALAKAQQRGEADLAYDLNNDGQINQHDIDFLANQAVALNTGEQS